MSQLGLKNVLNANHLKFYTLMIHLNSLANNKTVQQELSEKIQRASSKSFMNKTKTSFASMCRFVDFCGVSVITIFFFTGLTMCYDRL